MRMVDVILKKRGGEALAGEEIQYAVNGFTRGEIPDYQMSALLMAIWYKGMSRTETALLTDCMARSGDSVDLSPIPGVKADKHSTGGVGDKTSLVVCPIAAACGVSVAKMSGRGLGHTGGTIDKLESIPGFQTSLERERFFEIVRDIGLSIIGQTGNIAPADKELYALRDVTGTVDSLPLIASSIMSKKLAAGADAILLDVKTGSGAFMKTLEDSIALAEEMVSIGEKNGRRTAAVITDMNRPLGAAIGNSLEVIEAVHTLRGNGPADFTSVCLTLAANMLFLAGKGGEAACRSMAEQALADGSAFVRLRAMVEAQGGDVSLLDDTSRFPAAPFGIPVTSPISGWISGMQTEQCGTASVLLGAGRVLKSDPIDHSAGILLHKKTGDYAERGEVIAELFTKQREAAAQAKQLLQNAYSFSEEQPLKAKLILARVTARGVERY